MIGSGSAAPSWGDTDDGDGGEEDDEAGDDEPADGETDDEQGDSESEDEGDGGDEDGTGFGIVIAVLAIGLAGLVARNYRR